MLLRVLVPVVSSFIRQRRKQARDALVLCDSGLEIWMYPKKEDKYGKIADKRKRGRSIHMSGKKKPVKYTEEFKKTIVSLYQSGKTYAQIQREYGVSSSALSNWIRKYSQVKVDEDTILTAQQIKALQKRNAELE